MGRRIHVLIGQLAVGPPDAEFQILGLGSCIGLFLWSPRFRIGGMAHILLPEAPVHDARMPGKYADRAVPELWQRLCESLPAGVDPDFVAKMTGGAVMFRNIEHPRLLHIGVRTAEVVRAFLEYHKIPLQAEDIGGHEGRSVVAFNRDGRLRIQTRQGVVWL